MNEITKLAFVDELEKIGYLDKEARGKLLTKIFGPSQLDKGIAAARRIKVAPRSPVRHAGQLKVSPESAMQRFLPQKASTEVALGAQRGVPSAQNLVGALA